MMLWMSMAQSKRLLPLTESIDAVRMHAQNSYVVKRERSGRRGKKGEVRVELNGLI
jgi:hypothetical protein